jgi:hypothetical protein
MKRKIPASRDVTKHTIDPKSSPELANDLLGRYPKADPALLLHAVVSHYFLLLKFGSCAKERFACEFLNLVLMQAVKLENEAVVASRHGKGDA